MLTTDQLAEFDRRGVVRLSAFVDRPTAEGVADRVWHHLGRRGLDRDDPTTWIGGRLSKLQALRHAEVYEPFVTERLRSIADQLLGRGRWQHAGSPQALVTLPEPGPWVLPHRIWHFDVPARGPVDPPAALRVLGLVEAVGLHGGGTVVVEGSHELTRRLVIESADHDAGSSKTVRRTLARQHHWFRDLLSAGDDRDRFLQPTELDGVTVKASELTGDGGDIYLMHPWMLHGLSPNTSDHPRSMFSHTVLGTSQQFYDGGRGP